MTLALMRCEFADVICLFIYFYYYYYYYYFLFFIFIFFFSSFPHGVFIVRKLTVISIAPIQYCLAHLNELISVV